MQLAQPAQALHQEGRNVHVAMAGAGPLETQLARTDAPNLHLIGKLSKPDLTALYRQANLYCLPSRSEGFATTLLESAVCGTPATVANVGGTEELIPPDKLFGVIIANMETETIASALRIANSNRQVLQAQGLAAAKRVRNICSGQQTAKRTLGACVRANMNTS